MLLTKEFTIEILSLGTLSEGDIEGVEKRYVLILTHALFYFNTEI